MKKFIPFFLTLLSISFFVNNSKAQLVAGGIMFTGYNSTTTPDSYSFVAMVTIPSGTVISFTDNQWLTSNTLATNETTCIWTSGVILPLGTQVTITGTTPTISISGFAGTISGTALALASTGDQVLAYRGPSTSPVFISAIHMNNFAITPFGDCGNTTNAIWDPVCIGLNNGGTTLPTGLTGGATSATTAVWFGTEGDGLTEWDNAVFNGCGLSLTTASQIRTALGNPANWNKTNTLANAVTLPSSCTFFGVTAVSLVNFSAKLLSNKSSLLQWKVQEKDNVEKFIIEKSSDGITFKPLTTVNASSSTNGTYYYTDNELLAQNNYYRIKIIELSGKIFYSNIVTVNLKSEVDISVYPNPVVDKLTIQQFGSQYNKIAYLYAATGKVEQQINITSQQHSINIKSLAAGIYYLKMNGGKVFKIIKQ